MELFASKNRCCGCGLCAAVCAHNAISMQPDEEGYLYPVIDAALCRECGACKRACSFQQPPAFRTQQQYHAARHNDQAVLERSTSGGVFGALAAHTIAEGGVVFGAVMDDVLHVRHAMAQTPEELLPMHGSKYIPSDVSAVYPALETALREGRPVLFTGIPCQVAAMRRWVEQRCLPDGQLTTLDVLCHSLSSPLIWREYVQNVESHYNDRIQSIAFRSKKIGWSKRAMHVVLQDHGDVSAEQNRRLNYFNLWESQCMNRPSCHSCPFAAAHRMGDFTAGDFVGVEQVSWPHPAEEGVSVLLTNTDRARELLPNLPLTVMSVERKQCLQQSLDYAAAPPRDRDAFWRTYREGGFDLLVKKYGHHSLEKKIIYRIIVPVCKKLGIYQLACKLYLNRNRRKDA